jgi:hypothetical protein
MAARYRSGYLVSRRRGALSYAKSLPREMPWRPANALTWNQSTSQVHIPSPHPNSTSQGLYTSRSLDHDAIKWNRIMISSLCLSMIFSENRFPLFRIMLWCSGSEVRIMTAASSSCGLLNQSHTNGVDLTFATLPIASSKSECQIQNSIRNRYLLVVLGFQHSQACLPRRDANVGIGPLESMSC